MSGKRGLTALFLLVVLAFSVSAVEYDVISNSDEWYVCDADGNAPVFDGLGEKFTYIDIGTGDLVTDTGDEFCVAQGLECIQIELTAPADYPNGWSLSGSTDCDELPASSYNYRVACNNPNYVPEFGRFSASTLSGEEYNCIDTMTDIYTEQSLLPATEGENLVDAFRRCGGPEFIGTFCCFSPETYAPGELSSCDCRDGSGAETDGCILNPDACIPPSDRIIVNDENDVLKEYCGRTLTCFTMDEGDELDPDEHCDDQGSSGGSLVPQSSEVDWICSNGMLIWSTEGSGPPTKDCCYGDNHEVTTIPNDGSTCAELGGEVCWDENDECFGTDIEITTSDLTVQTCCFGGFCYTDTVLGDNYNIDESFICYKENGDNKFAECCYEGKCENPGANELYKYAHGVGNALHKVDSYDVYRDGYWDDYVKIKRTNQEEYITFGAIRNTDWRGYDTLEFDFAFDNRNMPTSITIGNEWANPDYMYTIVDGDNNAIPVSALSTNGFEPRRWHHIIVDLTSISGFDLSFIDSIRIGVNFDLIYPDGDVDGIPARTAEYAVDNIILRDDITSNDGDGNSATRYCAGGFGTWISDLDPIDGVDMEVVASYGPYQSACRSQVSFDWTGTRCCGDDTSLTNYKEYYNDDYHVCFGGVTIYDDWTLANATNVYAGSNVRVLSSGGELWACGADVYDDTIGGIRVSLEGENPEQDGDLILPPENLVSVFETRGSWYCDMGGWAYTEDVNNMKLIASSLKAQGETAGAGTYTLHCGGESNVVNEVLLGDDNFCVLQTNDKVTIGLAINSDELDDFLNTNLKAFDPFQEETDAWSCSFTPGTEFDAVNFFRECDIGTDWIEVYYNEPFGLLLFSLQESATPGGFIGFIQGIWDAFIGLFSPSFEQPDGFISIPSTVDLGEFSELYIKQVGVNGDLIFGIREQDTIVVTYRALDYDARDISFLVNLTEKWFEDNDITDVEITFDDFYYNMNDIRTGSYLNEAMDLGAVPSDVFACGFTCDHIQENCDGGWIDFSSTCTESLNFNDNCNYRSACSSMSDTIGIYSPMVYDFPWNYLTSNLKFS